MSEDGGAEPGNLMQTVEKGFLEIKMQIQMSDRTMPLEHTLWLECFRGNKIDVSCVWCRKSFLLTREQLQDNSTVRCWHCREENEALSALCEAHPGLLEEMLRPATQQLFAGLNEILKGFK